MMTKTKALAWAVARLSDALSRDVFESYVEAVEAAQAMSKLSRAKWEVFRRSSAYYGIRRV